MKRGPWPDFAIPHDTVKFTVAAIGTGASAPAAPVDGRFTPTTATYPRRANGISYAVAPTRTSAGIYVVTINPDFQLYQYTFGQGVVLSAGLSPTALLEADVTILDPVNQQVTVKVITGTGTATDLGTSDMLVLYLHGLNSNA
jgi:hypothetical protein